MIGSRQRPQRYDTFSIILHWASALAVLAMFPLGVVMARLGDPGIQLILYRAHIALGWFVVAMTVLRVCWRAARPAPAAPPMTTLHRAGFHFVHVGLLLILLALAGTGVVALLESGMAPVPPAVTGPVKQSSGAHDAHWLLAFVFGGLLLAHLLGVLSYRPRGLPLARMGLRRAARFAP